MDFPTLKVLKDGTVGLTGSVLLPGAYVQAADKCIKEEVDRISSTARIYIDDVEKHWTISGLTAQQRNNLATRLESLEFRNYQQYAVSLYVLGELGTVEVSFLIYQIHKTLDFSAL